MMSNESKREALELEELEQVNGGFEFDEELFNEVAFRAGKMVSLLQSMVPGAVLEVITKKIFFS